MTVPAAPPRKRGLFYHDLVTFEVEGEVQRVPRYGLERWSKSLFRDMFALPTGDAPAEGSSDAHPIVPPACSKLEFESLMAILYPWPLATADNSLTLTTAQWTAALKLARQWDMPEVAVLIIDNINKLELSTTEKVTLGRRFRNERLLIEGYSEIVKDCDSVSLDELGASMGWETAARLLAIWRKMKLAPSKGEGGALGITVPRSQMRCPDRRHST